MGMGTVMENKVGSQVKLKVEHCVLLGLEEGSNLARDHRGKRGKLTNTVIQGNFLEMDGERF